MYALMVEDAGAFSNREEVREMLDLELAVPFDPDEEEAYRREHWGEGREAELAELASERAGVPSYGDAS